MMNFQSTMSALTVAGVELAAVLVLCGVFYRLVLLLLLRPAAMQTGSLAGWAVLIRTKTRNVTLVVAAALSTAILAYNGWLLTRGIDALEHTKALLQSVTVETWATARLVLLKIALAAGAALVVSRLLRRVTRTAERAINRWDRLQDNNRSLAALFASLDRAIVNIGWMLVAVFTCRLVAAPAEVTDALALALRIYVVFAVGVTIVRSTSVIVDTLDGLSRRYAERRGWVQFYEHLRPLRPTLRASLEYVLWIGMASMIVVQLAPIRNFAIWGPRLIQVVGIFFAARVVIELGRLEIARRILPGEGLDETERRRRATMVPLVRTAFTYALYFGAAVLMLSSLGFNPMPFLAGAGIVGLVVGFGAQSLINDVVSGFFILFENTYLVGETIEVGAARGVVEAIEFRTTKIRDGEGRLHIIRNGDMKPIVNYSRDYMIAVVDINVTYDADLRGVFAALTEAGHRLRAESLDLLGETEIEGVVSFGTTVMTVRTVTRVRPGRSDAVAAALRLAIKEVFDRHAAGVPRRMLIPRSVFGEKPPAVTFES
jgi:small-conductance mechanosensitive channel